MSRRIAEITSGWAAIQEVYAHLRVRMRGIKVSSDWPIDPRTWVRPPEECRWRFQGLTRLSKQFARAAPTVVAVSLIAGNTGLLFRHGLHPNLETGVGLLWIASDYALRQKNKHPIAAPRLNAAGVILGSLFLSASGIHAHSVDWHRVRTSLGYIPAASVIGFQEELRQIGSRWTSSPSRLTVCCGAVMRHPYLLAAVMNAYGVIELCRSALTLNDRGLLAISAAYGLATLFLPLLDVDATS